MDFPELQKRLESVAKLDLAPLIADYQARGGAEDVDGFLAYLGASRAVAPEVLKELASATEVDLSEPDVLGLARTALGGFVAPVGVATAPGATVLDTQGPPAGASAAQPGPARAQASRFQTLSTLGQGAMGAISIARDVHLRRKVALKTALPNVATHPQHLHRFLVEMQVTAQLEHPNIVPVYAVESGDAGFGYAMKLVHGVDLARLIDDANAMVAAGKPLDDEHKLEKRLEIFLKICDAVDFAHSKGVIHRDLKPANVMIGRHNEVYLMDWGIARLIGTGGQAHDAGISVGADDANPNDVLRTRVGSLLGTPTYMSPEQVKGRQGQLDARSDQYTMGLILQECVTLIRAVGGTTLDEVLKKAYDARPDPAPVGPHAVPMPRELAAIVRKATQKNPDDRYPSVSALAEDVRRHLAGEPVSVLPEGGLRKAGRWLAKHRTATLAIVLGVGLAGSIATTASLLVGQSQVAAEHAHELRVSELQAESAIEAQLIDHQLTRYEAALAGFVGAAQVILTRAPPADAAPLFDEGFAIGAANAPADLAASIRYGKPVSVLVPVASLAPGVSREIADPWLRSLGWITPSFRALLVGSNGDESHDLSAAELRAAIADVGVPGFRAVVALKEGASLSFPGMAGNAATDDRAAGFFKVAEAAGRPSWGPVTIGKQASLPLSAPLYDESGAFRGVALLEVSLDRLLARPGVAKIGYVQSRFLVDRHGQTVAEDSRQGGAAPIANEVLEAIGRGESGTHEYTVDGHRWQYAYYPLTTLDDYYVAAGDARQMVESTAKVETSDPRKVIRAAARPVPTAKPAAAVPTAVAAVDAGTEPDAGAEADASADASADVVPFRKPGPMPTAAPTVKPAASQAEPAPTAAPAEPPPPPNPFEKWQIYKKPGKP